MDDKFLIEMSTALKHIDIKTDKIEKNQEQIQVLIGEIQRDNIIAMSNNSQLKDRIEKVEIKFEKSKEGIYKKIEDLECEFRSKTQNETNKFYEYIRDLFKAEKIENENIKNELREEFTKLVKMNTDLIFNKVKVWIYGGVITIILLFAKDIIFKLIG
jgi:hypothetical protein